MLRTYAAMKLSAAAAMTAATILAAGQPVAAQETTPTADTQPVLVDITDKLVAEAPDEWIVVAPAADVSSTDTAAGSETTDQSSTTSQ